MDINETVSESDKEKKSKVSMFTKPTLIAVSVLAALFVVMIAFFSVGIYALRWQGPAIGKVQNALPFPMAVVNGRFITFMDFSKRYEAYKKSITANQVFDFNDPANAQAVVKQKTDLLSRMVDLKLEEVLAARMNVSVSKSDIDKELAIFTANGSSEFEKSLQDTYGWKIQDFVAELVVPQLREQKLRKALVADEKMNAKGYETARDIKTKLGQGADFAELAKQYSQDTTSKDLGGDLGWIVPEDLAPDFREAVFKLQPKQVSDILTSPYGLHIVQVLESSKDDSGKTSVHLRQIMLSDFNFDQWLEQQRNEAKVWKFAVN